MSIFARSDLDRPEIPHRTVIRSGQPAIIGASRATVGDLAGIAHELGHCLYEESSEPSTLARQIASEIAAHVMEEEIVSEYFHIQGESDLLHMWSEYQRRIDIINVYFFLLEGHQIFGWDGAPESLFASPATAFRESLFVLPGYQIAYAEAALARLTRLSRTKQDNHS
jgi:hypothetical protein